MGIVNKNPTRLQGKKPTRNQRCHDSGSGQWGDLKQHLLKMGSGDWNHTNKQAKPSNENNQFTWNEFKLHAAFARLSRRAPSLQPLSWPPADSDACWWWWPQTPTNVHEVCWRLRTSANPFGALLRQAFFALCLHSPCRWHGRAVLSLIFFIAGNLWEPMQVDKVWKWAC